MKKLKHINEYKNIEIENLSMGEQELMEMANLDSEVTGIDNIVIWVGPNPGQHWKRIKVSNAPEKFDGEDCFVLTIPDFEVRGKVNTKLITGKVLDKIKTWVTQNIEAIEKYSEYKIPTNKFISQITPVK